MNFSGNDDGNDFFNIEICGTIHGPEDNHETMARIFVSDITDGPYKACSVHGAAKEWQMKKILG